MPLICRCTRRSIPVVKFIVFLLFATTTITSLLSPHLCSAFAKSDPYLSSHSQATQLGTFPLSTLVIKTISIDDDQQKITSSVSFSFSPTSPLSTLAFEIYDFCYDTCFLSSRSLHLPAQVNDCVNTLTSDYENNISTETSSPSLSAYTIDLRAHYNSHLFPDQSDDQIDTDHSPLSNQKKITMQSSDDNKSYLFIYNTTTPIPTLYPGIAYFCSTTFMVDKEECEVMITKQVQEECEVAMIERVTRKLLIHHSNLYGHDRLNIFYNIYLGADESKYNSGVSIVEEQTNTILNSAFANATVYYKTIGRPLPPTSTLSTQSNFHHLGHHQEGGEGVTLTPLYHFCVNNPDEIVAYIHNKGSYRDSDQNTIWRRRLMNGILSSTECFDALRLDKAVFNVCGLRFATFSMLHFSGNMWLAKCSYVRKLLPPLEFTIAHTSAVDKIFEETTLIGTGESAVFDYESFCEVCFLVSRYSLEHWVTSSPHLSPADVLPDFEFTYIYGLEIGGAAAGAFTNNSVLDFKLEAAPRFGVLVFMKGLLLPVPASISNITLSKLNSTSPFEGLFAVDFKLYQTFYTLKAKMFFWKLIYNDFPTSDSWVWNYYGEKEVRELLLAGVRNLGVDELESGHKFMVDERNNLHHV